MVVVRAEGGSTAFLLMHVTAQTPRATRHVYRIRKASWRPLIWLYVSDDDGESKAR
jgi:hypothetical protein